MSYKLLRQLISYLKKKAPCPLCSFALTDDAIFVLSTGTGCGPGSPAFFGLFFLVCMNCGDSAFGMVELFDGKTPLKEVNIHMERKPMQEGVSVNEVLDMHNFLKQWKGDDIKKFFMS